MSQKRIKREVVPGVYCIEHIDGQSLYVGSSADIYRRWNDHKNLLNKKEHHCVHLQNAWDKYGEKSFEFKILEVIHTDRMSLYKDEQRWYDYYKGIGKHMYNISDCVLLQVPNPASYEDLKNGALVFNEMQFNEMCWYFINTRYSIERISRIVGVKRRTVQALYDKTEYKELTKDMKFVQRNNIGSNNAMSKLSEDDVKDIICRLQTTESLVSIATRYNVSSTTINDIKCHKTWTYLTKDIVFMDLRIKQDIRGRPIVEIDDNNNIIGEYISAAAAGRALGIASTQNITNVCRYTRKHACGHMFMYKDEYYKKFILN